jgi:4-amino-4-deoxy-L-arabinose transferase-like glycosyltransferase
MRAWPAPYHAPMPQRWLRRAAIFLPAAAVLAVLAPFVDADPADGFTFSNSPFTDEAWWLANARNFALFGEWSTDDWNLHLVSPVYSVLQAAALSATGVDMMAARLVVIGAVALTCLILALGLRRPFGVGPAVAAAAGYGFSALVLYYGRLAYLEPLVALGLAAGAFASARPDTSRPWLWGLIGGGLFALAIGVKPTAVPLVGGMIAVLLVVDGARSPWPRRWALGATAAVLAAALAWSVAVIVPQREAVSVVARILAEVTLPENPGELLYRVLSYPLSNDRALIYSLPLLLGGTAGVVLGWAQRDSLAPSTRRLLVIAAGWVVVGVIVLMVIPYRPNRYFLPLLPGLAMLTAGALSLWRGWARQRLPAWAASRLFATLAIALLTLPGLLMHLSQMHGSTRNLVPLQERVAAALPEGAAVEGSYAPLLAFRAPAVAIVSRPAAAVNPGDLYTVQGVRWLVLEPGEEPAWAGLQPAAWDARQIVLCEPWGRVELCLVRVP